MSELLDSVAATIAEYRKGEITPPDAKHVERWVLQFDEELRVRLLTEMHHVLRHSYISKSTATTFLEAMVTNNKLTGGDATAFWKDTTFLDIQSRGASQKQFLAMFGVHLKVTTGLKLKDCGTDSGRYVYLDDGLFTGMTMLNGLTNWLISEAPPVAEVHVITIVLHRSGQYFTRTKLVDLAQKLEKNITFTWWHSIELDDTRANINNSDVLRPVTIPEDDRTKAYVKELKFSPLLRTPGSVGELNIFSSEDGRNLLEQQFLTKGAYIREISPRLPRYARPLGNTVLETLGFGSTIVTFRNCPNNAPLAFWAGDPWFPLFPRNTN